jgi:hypothetical protein
MDLDIGQFMRTWTMDNLTSLRHEQFYLELTGQFYLNLDKELETWDRGLFEHDDYDTNEKLCLIMKGFEL